MISLKEKISNDNYFLQLSSRKGAQYNTELLYFVTACAPINIYKDNAWRFF